MSDAATLVRRARAAEAQTPVPSPCVSICRMDAGRELCEGCLRTLPEIAAWGSLGDADRRAVWRRIAERARARETP